MKKIIKRNQSLFFIHVILCAIAALIQVGVALVYRQITEVAMSGDVRRLVLVGIFAFFYILLNTMSDFIPRRSKAVLVQTIMNQLRERLSQKIIRMNPVIFLKNKKNEYLSMFVNEMKVVESEFLKPGLGLILSVFTFFFSLLFTLKLNTSFSLIMLLLAFSPLLAPYFAKRILSNRRKSVVVEQDRTLGLFDQLLAGYMTLRVGRAFPKYLKIFNKSSEQLTKKSLNFETLQGLTYAISFGLGDLAYSGTWIIGGFFVATQRISIPDLIAMTTLMSTISGPLQYFSTSVTDILASKKVADDLLCFLDNTADDEPERPLELAEPIRSISVDNLHFYHGNRLIFNGFTQTFERGKKYAITGASGSGKSTLLNILAGIYPVDNHQVLVNDQEMNQLSRDSLYQKVALVQQKTAIFQTSIAYNISSFSEYELEKIIDVLERSGLGKRFDDNQLTDTQDNTWINFLSGGELRRLEIARAIFKDSDVILFDEPTSGLDSENERIIRDLICSLTDKVIIVVTHSTSQEFLSSFDERIQLNT